MKEVTAIKAWSITCVCVCVRALQACSTCLMDSMLCGLARADPWIHDHKAQSMGGTLFVAHAVFECNAVSPGFKPKPRCARHDHVPNILPVQSWLVSVMDSKFHLLNYGLLL